MYRRRSPPRWRWTRRRCTACWNSSRTMAKRRFSTLLGSTKTTPASSAAFQPSIGSAATTPPRINTSKSTSFCPTRPFYLPMPLLMIPFCCKLLSAATVIFHICDCFFSILKATFILDVANGTNVTLTEHYAVEVSSLHPPCSEIQEKSFMVRLFFLHLNRRYPLVFPWDLKSRNDSKRKVCSSLHSNRWSMKSQRHNFSKKSVVVL